MNPLPLTTVVVPSFNQADFLERIIHSVLAQDCPVLGPIVVDGGSSDGSRSTIERYADRLKWWCSQPGGSPVHAIAKGLAGHWRRALLAEYERHVPSRCAARLEVSSVGTLTLSWQMEVFSCKSLFRVTLCTCYRAARCAGRACN